MQSVFIKHHSTSIKFNMMSDISCFVGTKELDTGARNLLGKIPNMVALDVQRKLSVSLYTHIRLRSYDVSDTVIDDMRSVIRFLGFDPHP